jgi:hypothetical protein
MSNDKKQLSFCLSKEHLDSKDDIVNCFQGLPIEYEGDYYRLSESDLPMQIMIFVSGAILGGGIYDLFKFGIKRIFKKFPNAQIALRDEDANMYSVDVNLNVKVIVVPGEERKFKNVNDLDLLKKFLEKDK